MPIGYVRQANGGITLDPDEQVQHIVRLIFRKLEEFGTLHALLQHLVHHEITLGMHERCGETKGRLVWRRPNRITLQNLLHHPMYAGAYCSDDARSIRGASNRAGSRPDAWSARRRSGMRCCATAYRPISLGKRTKLIFGGSSRTGHSLRRGSARKGAALLGGLVVCGLCRWRMLVRYRDGHASYVCQSLASNYGGTSCQHIVGDELEN